MSVDVPHDLVFPLNRRDPFRPPPEYIDPTGAEMRRCPLGYGGDAWLVTGLKATRAILADGVNFSADNATAGFPAVPMASKRQIPGHFLTMDAPEHTRLRQLVTAQFSAGRVRQLLPRMRAAVNKLVDDLVSCGSPADLIATVAVPLPAVTASEMLGTPLADLDFFLAVTRDLQAFNATAVQRVAAAGRMTRYLEKAILDARGRPDDDMLSVLARTLDAGEEFSLAELVGVANLVIIAGLETTAGLTGLTVLSLLTNQAQGDLVRSDPQRWAGPAVLEALRCWTLVQHGIARVATRDVDVLGHPVRAGDAVVLSLVTANRDPSAFPEPDAFDITRDARQQVSFGHGSHRCLGAPIALAQTELAVAELMTRLPDLRLARPVTELSFLDEMLIYGLRALPVSW